MHGAPTEVVVPDPASRPRYDGLIGAAFAGIAAAFIVIVGANASPLFAGLGVGLPVAVGIGALAWVFGRPRRLRLRRVGDQVVGMPGGPLLAGVGRIVVERVAHRSAEGTAFLYELRHEGASKRGPRVLVPLGYQPTCLRACAEGLCRLGGYPMVWKSLDGDEVRTPDALDAPLVARLAAGPGLDPEQGPGGAGAPAPVVVPLAGGGVAIGSTRLAGRVWAVSLGAFAVVGLVNGLTEAPGPGVPWYRPLTGDLAWWIGAALLLFAAVRAVHGRLAIREDRVEGSWSLLGIPLHRWRIPVATLESVYVEEGQLFHALVFAGDGFHHRAGRFGTLADAAAARRAVVAALLGHLPEGAR